MDVFKTYYGPLLKTFAALQPSAQANLNGELFELIARLNRAKDGTMVVASEYLEVTIQALTHRNWVTAVLASGSARKRGPNFDLRRQASHFGNQVGLAFEADARKLRHSDMPGFHPHPIGESPIRLE
jgi:hypothetical protein